MLVCLPVALGGRHSKWLVCLVWQKCWPLPVTTLAFILAWAQGRPSKSNPFICICSSNQSHVHTGPVPNPLLTPQGDCTLYMWLFFLSRTSSGKVSPFEDDWLGGSDRQPLKWVMSLIFLWATPPQLGNEAPVSLNHPQTQQFPLSVGFVSTWWRNRYLKCDFFFLLKHLRLNFSSEFTQPAAWFAGQPKYLLIWRREDPGKSLTAVTHCQNYQSGNWQTWGQILACLSTIAGANPAPGNITRSESEVLPALCRSVACQR